VGEEDEHHGGDAVDDGRDHVLQRVHALQVVLDEDGKDRDVDDAHGGAEVPAVDGRCRDRATERPRPARPPWMPGHIGGEPWLQEHEDHRDHDQNRHDAAKDRLRKG
jgi:hypothetical protein